MRPPAAPVPHVCSRRSAHTGRVPGRALEVLAVLVFLALAAMLCAVMASWSDLGTAPGQVGPATSFTRQPDSTSSRSLVRLSLVLPRPASTLLRDHSGEGAIPAGLLSPSGPSRVAAVGMAPPRPAPVADPTSPSALDSRSVATRSPDVPTARGTGTSGPSGYERLRAAIAWCESRDEPTVVNPTSGASGLYQFIDSTWRAVTGRTDKASDATPAEQTAAFDVEFATSGTSPWSSSRWCWEARLS